MLLKIEGMSLGPRDVTVTAKRRTDAGKLSFSHAVVEVDTKSKCVLDSFNVALTPPLLTLYHSCREDLATATYSLDDPTVVNLSAGWKKNGSYWVADADNSISFNWIGKYSWPALSQPDVNFHLISHHSGHSIAVYGQCTSADEFIGTWPRIDGLISLGPDIDRKIGQYIVDDCLMHYFTWKLLVPTSHNYTWPTGGRPLRLNRIVVTEFGALLPFDEQLSHDDKTLSAGEIAGIAVGSAFLVALVTLIVFWLRRRNLLAANRSSRTIPVEPTPLQINASETPRELKSAAQFMPSLAAEPGSPSSPSYDPYAEFQPSSQGR